MTNEMITRTVFYPMFQRPDHAIGTGSIGYSTKQEAIKELISRDKQLRECDIRQWVKIVHTNFEGIYNAME